MISIPGRVFAKLRVWLGLNDPSENQLYPSHGWLLPRAVVVRARAAEALATDGRVGVRAGRRQD